MSVEEQGDRDSGRARLWSSLNRLVARIVGSVGRYREFDRWFRPKGFGAGTRWKRIDRAFHRGGELPPVSLYKLGGDHFVHYGNHRVSVARYQGVEVIDAYVTEFYQRRTSAGGGRLAPACVPCGC